MEGIEIYKALSQPPKSALRTIIGGKLKGMTDINPQWRYEAMTKQFGLVGIGWKYEIQRLWTEQGAGGEVLAFAQVAVFIRDGDKWSEGIIGIGGSRLVSLEKGNLVSSDEGFKMAVTDAFSTALKMIGVAADVYAGRWDGSKYSAPASEKIDFVKIKEMLSQKKEDGTNVFSESEIADFRAKAKTMSSADLCALVSKALKERTASKNSE